MEMREDLAEFIENLKAEADELPLGSKDWLNVITGIDNAYKVYLEDDRGRSEIAQENERLEQELEVEKDRTAENHRQFMVNTAFNILVLAFEAGRVLVTLKFEETGYIRSSIGKSFKSLTGLFQKSKA